MASPKRFRPEINVRAASALVNTVTQSVLEDGHAGVLLDEAMQHFAFASKPTLSSFTIPGPDRDLVCRRAAFGALTMDAGALAATHHTMDDDGECLTKANRACLSSFTLAALQFPAALSNAEGLKSAFDLAMAEIVRERAAPHRHRAPVYSANTTCSDLATPALQGRTLPACVAVGVPHRRNCCRLNFPVVC